MTTTIYNIKYLFSAGILKQEAETISNDLTATISYPNGTVDFIHEKDWANSLPVAIEKAQIKRTQKIKSLQKQIDRLYNLNF